MNFPSIWVGWIMECISTVSYSVLVNGSPTERFWPTAGLRQGDPLSPYIFILCMEVLSRKIESLQRNNTLKGIALSRRGERISHLFFADDALFCFEATPDSCHALKEVLEDFCKLSGEMINYKKSHVQYSKNTPTKFIHFMRKPLGVQSQRNLGTYLGCPMDVDGRNSACFKGIHDKVMRCISSWKFSCLAITGRCILINSVLMALAAHIMAVYLLPKKILNKINSTILRFLWRGNKEGKPIYWRSQTLLEQKKHEGGMGLRNIDSLNQALLFRQVWRINKKPDSLVGRILTQKYGGNPLQVARWNRMPTNTSWAFKSMVKCARIMLPGCGKRIGNGQSTRIVEDTWAGNLPVKFKRNNPPSHDNAPKYVKELLRGRTWDTSKVWYYFNRSDAQRVLSTYIPQHEKEDETIWLPKEDGNYSVKSGYWFFHSQALKREQSNFWKILWKSQMSQRWKIFCWKMVHDALPTRENLAKRRIKIDPSCVFCGNKESSDHLFLNCEFSRRIWSSSNLGIRISNCPSPRTPSWFKN
ncbi:hypothetical protein RDABS01_023732, partial [Bienertia sinuspersici]